MSNSNYPLMVLIFVVFIAIAILNKRYLKTKVREFEQSGRHDTKKASAGFLAYPIIGSIFIIVILINWKSVPPGNEIFGLAFIYFGLGMAGYGLYKWFRARRGDNK